MTPKTSQIKVKFQSFYGKIINKNNLLVAAMNDEFAHS